jgi:hypothetical protein
LDDIAANRYPAVNWKADLRMSRREFTDYERLAQGAASVCTAVERYLMHSALAMRKLLVQQVLTDEVADANRPVLSYPCIRRPRERWCFENTVDMENLHHFVRHYDMQSPRRESLNLKRFADILIHSFVFAVWLEEGGTFEDARVFFNSDHNQKHVVYELRVADFSSIVEEVIDDEIGYRFTDRSTGRYHRHNWTWVRRKREAEEAEDRRRFAGLAQTDAGVVS